MSIKLSPIHYSDVSKYIIQKVDWRYFQLAAIVSAMYIFNVIVISFVGGRAP